MADIILRAADWMAGTSQDWKDRPGPEREFFRGKALKNVSPGDRVYFLEGREITGYATYKTYEPRYWKAQRESDTPEDEGWWNAYVIAGPYVLIKPPVQMTDGYQGRFPARYVHTVPGLSERLRREAP